jgi:hypothetical protein
MDKSLRTFIVETAGAAAAALALVLVVAFLTVPHALGNRAGDARPAAAGVAWHPS